jgi:hypothetical protein
VPACSNLPVRLDDLCAGGIQPDELGLTATPQASYVAPADRYAVVPDQSHTVPDSAHGVGTVPEMPVAKKPRS